MYPRIEVCGVIASGKTSFLDALQPDMYVVGKEDFLRNPFLEEFYKDPVANAFETEISFLLQHFHSIKLASNQGRPAIHDFSLVLDLAYAEVTLPERDRQVFGDLFSAILDKVSAPDLIVWLRCDPRVEHRRIAQRARPAEALIELSYLQELDQSLSSTLMSPQFMRIPKLEVDSAALDFVNSAQDKQQVRTLLAQAVGAKL